MRKVLGMRYFTTKDIRRALILKYKEKDFDATGNISLLGVSFIADKDWIVRKPNYEYVNRELQWYESKSLNVDDIPGQIPKIWNNIAGKTTREINSNYGWMIWSEENNYQYNHVLEDLKAHPNSRQALMIYMRPTMHEDSVRDGMKDFTCTWGVTCKIEKDKLYYLVNMRSNDSVFGYGPDYCFHYHVFGSLLEDLNKYRKETNEPLLKMGNIIWHCDNFHVYPKDFKHLDELINNTNNNTGDNK